MKIIQIRSFNSLKETDRIALEYIYISSYKSVFLNDKFIYKKIYIVFFF